MAVDRYTNDPTRNASSRTTHDPTAAQGGGGGGEPSSDVFFENRHSIESGMKPQTASGMGGVLIA